MCHRIGHWKGQIPAACIAAKWGVVSFPNTLALSEAGNLSLSEVGVLPLDVWSLFWERWELGYHTCTLDMRQLLLRRRKRNFLEVKEF